MANHYSSPPPRSNALKQKRAGSAIELTFLPLALERLRIRQPTIQELGWKSVTTWAAMIPGSAFILSNALPVPWSMSFLQFIIVAGAGVGIGSFFDQRRLEKIRMSKPAIARENQRLITTLLSAISNRKVRRYFDGRSAQILEGAAFHYERIFTILDKPHWRDASAESPWHALGRQAEEAANQAMHELLAYHRMAYGEPQHGSAIGKTFDTLEHELLSLEGELGAVMGKMRTPGIRWSRHAYQHPHFDQVFAPSLELAQSLQVLADELERKTQTSAQAPRSAPEAVHRLIHEFRALEVAERELDETDARAWLQEEINAPPQPDGEPPEHLENRS